jgi:hypothetical protein
VFIAPPLPDGKTLLVRRRRDRAKEERDKADTLERLLRQPEIGRLRKDDAVFNDIVGYRGTKTAVTVVIANLLDAKDAGRKKALARVRRELRAGAKERNEEAD